MLQYNQLDSFIAWLEASGVGVSKVNHPNYDNINTILYWIEAQHFGWGKLYISRKCPNRIFVSPELDVFYVALFLKSLYLQ